MPLSHVVVTFWCSIVVLAAIGQISVLALLHLLSDLWGLLKWGGDGPEYGGTKHVAPCMKTCAFVTAVLTAVRVACRSVATGSHHF